MMNRTHIPIAAKRRNVLAVTMHCQMAAAPACSELVASIGICHAWRPHLMDQIAFGTAFNPIK
jgi:hypothetical protein